MGRRDDVFHVLKVIQRTVDEQRDRVEHALLSADAGRTVDDRHDPIFVMFVLGLIADRAALATALATIDRALAEAGIRPRTQNLGVGARDTGKTTEH